MSWVGRRRDQAASPSRTPGRPLSACQPRISFTHGSWREFCRTTKNGGCAPLASVSFRPNSPCAESRRSLHAAFNAAIEGGARAPTPPRRTCGTAATMPMRAIVRCSRVRRPSVGNQSNHTPRSIGGASTVCQGAVAGVAFGSVLVILQAYSSRTTYFPVLNLSILTGPRGAQVW